MSDPDSRFEPPAWLRATGRLLLSLLLILWTLFELILTPLFRPLLALLSGLRLFEVVGAWVGRLPPYAALVALAVPFVIIEPFKAFALYWFGIGHFVQGAVLYVLGHLASILVVDRLYHAAHAPLMRIGWFRRLMTWLDGIRRVALDWARSTAAWRSAARLATGIKTTVRGWLRTAGRA
jgi:hypothetical protein